MRVRFVARGLFRIFAVISPRGECDLLDFVSDSSVENESERAALLALLRHVAESGPPRNIRKSRPLSGDILELKAGALRVPHFFDEGRLVICTKVIQKPKETQIRREIAKAERIRADYQAAKANGTLVFEED